ncbi:MAG: tripartite tricarboxylate transporter substrate binding protein [Burkholderiales bacterium]|mgnify:CR=1 FL=1|nr:tripartite tricarboxylate transporter substrate binding protein [Burkholderiales bacterium]
MTITRRGALAAIGANLAAGCLPAWAQQDYPNKPVRLVVPFPPGGPADVIGRTAGQAITQGLGQPALIENRPGASGNIGADAVAKAAPDGYTLLVGNIAINAINSHVYKSVPFDPIKDFTPICSVVAPLMTLSVHPSVPANTVAEFVAYAKRNPGKLGYATSGLATPHHLAGALLCQMADIDMISVPYKGASPAVTDVVGGQCPVGFLSLSVALPYHRSGRLRILGMVESTRASVLPDVPTVGETVKGFEMSNWQGIFGPAKLPMSIAQTVYRECAKGFNANRATLESQGLGVMLNTPEQFAAFVAAENDKWARFVKALNLKLE